MGTEAVGGDGWRCGRDVADGWKKAARKRYDEKREGARVPAVDGKAPAETNMGVTKRSGSGTKTKRASEGSELVVGGDSERGGFLVFGDATLEEVLLLLDV